MNCAAYEKQIALYVEGDLPASDRRRVETHLQTCTVCSGLAEELDQVIEVDGAVEQARAHRMQCAGQDAALAAKTVQDTLPGVRQVIKEFNEGETSNAKKRAQRNQ